MLGQKRNQSMFTPGSTESGHPQPARPGPEQEPEWDVDAQYPLPGEYPEQTAEYLPPYSAAPLDDGEADDAAPMPTDDGRRRAAEAMIRQQPGPRRFEAPPEPEDDDEEEDIYRRGLSSGEGKLRTHSLFFTPSRGGSDLGSVLQDVQEYISSKYATLITNGGNEETKTQIKRYISKYVQDHRIAVEGMTSEILIDTLYTEMAEYGFLTKYIYGTGIEEINLNSWRDCEVLYSNGQMVKLEERFDSPDHAINVVRRMLHISGMVLDNSSPAVLGHLSKNIRIAVLKTPLVDEDVGVSASIRIVNPQSMQKKDFIRGGTATDPMMDFLAECLRYGISICVAGATGSGKTTVAGWLLTTIPHNKRIFTIENGSRELDLVREKDGCVINSVIHTITRTSENERQNIDQDMLLDMALRYHPDVICVGEMRSYEAYTAQEAARTGHAVLTTIHSNSCSSTWRRMVTLCKRKYEMGDDTLMDLVTEAFPIVVYAKQLENKKRVLMQIMECAILPDGTREYNNLYHYQITENRLDHGKYTVHGYHEAVTPMSEGLQKRFLENGMPSENLEKLLADMKAEQGKEVQAK